MSRREEWLLQCEVAIALDRWLDPARALWTAVDNVASSATSGAMRKRRGVRPGLPDCLIWYRRSLRARLIGIELKSPEGRCSAAQRTMRAALLRMGVEWWECRSLAGVMYALRKSGVKFRAVIHDDGTVERWRQPRLAPWELPRRDPAEPRPIAPDVKAQRRAARQRWREQHRTAPPNVGNIADR